MTFIFIENLEIGGLYISKPMHKYNEEIGSLHTEVNLDEHLKDQAISARDQILKFSCKFMHFQGLIHLIDERLHHHHFMNFDEIFSLAAIFSKVSCN